MTFIKSLRGLGFYLPREIMYQGEEDLGQEYRESPGGSPSVITCDLSRMVDDVGWELEGATILLQTMVEAVLTLSRLAIRRVHPGSLGLQPLLHTIGFELAPLSIAAKSETTTSP
ncbi:hypothetical protein KCU95_g44, partial [Aureobasidium melanogenum]